MFGQNKPGGYAGFGTSTSSFGGFGQSSTGFGTGGSAFGTQTPGTNTNLFGAASGTTGGTGTGLFGQSSNTGFGQQQGAGPFSFGTGTSNSAPGGLFGGASQTGTGTGSLFSSPATGSGFGAKTGFSGFGATPSQPSTGGLFGATAGATPSLFSGTTGAFGSVGSGGTTLAFNPPSGQDTMMKSGITTNISTRHQCITAMKEYENKSLEELRFEDYSANRKAKQAGATSSGGMFGQTQTAPPSNSSGFVFGAGLGSGLQTNTSGFGSFGSTNNSSASSAFSANRTLFGTTTTTQSGFGFGASTGTQQSSSLFGNTNRSLFGQATAQPSLTSGNSFFGSTVASTASNPVGFGTTTPSGGLFGTAKPAAFGTATTSSFSGFGTGTSLFAKPASTASSFGFGTNTSTTGFGSTSGGGLFSIKPGGFGTTTTGGLGSTGTTGFGFGSGLNTGSSTNTFGSAAPKPVFGFNFAAGTSTGTTGFGSTLGTGTTPGTFNLGGGTTTSGTSVIATSQAQGTQHLMALASSPYGDNPLFWNLKQQSKERRDDTLKPTNPNAQKAALSSANQYKVSPRPTAKIKPKSLHNLIVGGKTQLFEGLEDEDNSFGEDTFVPRKSVKKLVLRKGISSKSSDLSSSVHVDAVGDFSSQLNDLSNNKAALPPPITRPLNLHQQDISLSNEAEATAPTHKTPPPIRHISDTLNSSLDDSIVMSSNNRLSAADTTSFLNASDLDASCSPEDSTPHPTGVTLTRPGYYTIPSLDEMLSYLDENGDCYVEDLTIGREGYGNAFFPGVTNVAGMNLDEIIHFRRKEIVVYPDDDRKPPLGQGLNKKAEITLDCVWPNDKATKTTIKSPERLKVMNYVKKIEEITTRIGGKFIDYRPETGSWVFQVNHFSKYGLLDDSDDESDLTDQQKLLLGGQVTKDILLVQKLQIQQLATEQKDKAKKADQNDIEILKEKARLDRNEQDMINGDEVADLSSEEDMLSYCHKQIYYENEEESQTGLDSKLLASTMGISAKNIQTMKASFFGDWNEKKTGYSDKEMDVDVKSIFRKTAADKLGGGLFVSFKQQAALSLPQSPAFSDKDQYEKTGYEPAVFGKSGMYDLSKDLLRPTPQTFLHPPVLEHKLLGSGLQPQDAPPRIVGTLVRHSILHVKDSILYNNQRPFVDAAFFMGRSFRVGWGLPWTLVHSGSLMGLPEDEGHEVSLLPLKSGRVKSSSSVKSWMAHIEEVQVADYMDSRDSKLLAQQEEMLKIHLAHSRYNIEEGCPVFVPEPGVAALHQISDVIKSGIADMSTHPDGKVQEHMNMVFSLCVALWGNLLNIADLDKNDIYHETQLRRQALSSWLTETGTPKVLEEMECSLGKEGYLQKVFSKLTVGEISKACELAQEGRDHCLALLLSQAIGSMATRQMIAMQLTQWAEHNTCQFISDLRLKIYCLLAGQLVWHYTSPEEEGVHSSMHEINTCQGLDWKRALAFHLWYKSPPNASIQHVLRQYQQGFKGGDQAQPYCSPPLPPYLEDEDMLDSQEIIFDTAYHLLCLYSDKSYGLESLLSPTSSSASHLDFRLSWHLLEILQALQYSHLSPYHTESINVSFAAQLEALGLWHWAAFILLHIRDTGHRQKAVMDLLQRHVELGEPFTDSEQFLVESLHVPAQWLHEAKAIKAHHEGDYDAEAKHWIAAGHYNRGHSVVIKHLASDAIINDEDIYLKTFLDQLAPPEHCVSIVNWSNAGKVFLDFINVRKRLDELKQSEPTAYDLEELQPVVLSLCKRVKMLPCHNSKDRLCQAELAKTIANLLRTFMTLCGRSPVKLLTNCLADLPMPEDYTRQELQALTRAYLLEIV